MSEVSVNSKILLKLNKLCLQAKKELETTTSNLQQQYRELGKDWKDSKYKEFGEIVDECCKALKHPISDLNRADRYLAELYGALEEYESIHFDGVSGSGQERQQTRSVGSSSTSSRTFGGSNNLFSFLFNRNRNLYDSLSNVEHRPIVQAISERTEEEIINSISGGDRTKGSCSSLAFAYAGNRAGYTVYDFRDGRSRMVFSQRSTIEQIANMDGVESVIEYHTNDGIGAELLMSQMQRGREYYMATGGHAAIVRINDAGHYQYLELQSGDPSRNGWHSLTLEALSRRFHCVDNQRVECGNYLIALDSLQTNAEFLNLLGYINTDINAQVRGENGHER